MVAGGGVLFTFLIICLMLLTQINRAQCQLSDLTMEDGFWSDYLTLHVANSTFMPSHESVFARVHHPVGYAVCEVAGALIRSDQANALTSAPLIIAPDRKWYYVIGTENDVCFKINDCVDPTSTDFLAFPGCETNAYFKYSNFGKLFVYPKREIMPGEEIFVYYGLQHWSWRRANFGVESNYYATYPSLNYPLPPTATDSDYLSIFVAPSLLGDGVGLGLFAKFDIPEGEIICEHRGLTYRYGQHPKSDKLSHLYVVDEQPFVIVGVAPCSIANDAADILDRVYTMSEYENIVQSPQYDIIPTMPGYSYNAVKLGYGSRKRMTVATKNISAGAEILCSFGKNYWLPWLKIATTSIADAV